jgi:hypothetical protein
MTARMTRVLTMVVVLLGVAAGVLLGRSPGGVDWSRARVVCIESDDWGLCGFLPDSAAAVAMDPDVLDPGFFPDVYWRSTLEDSAAVALLAGILAEHRGRDGLPAVLQPNYIMASLEFVPADGSEPDGWIRHDLPDVPARYRRSGLWRAVEDAMSSGVWHPEYHGRWHFDPQRRRERSMAEGVRAAAGQQILVFPGSERSWELAPWRSRADVAADFDAGVAAFANLFGYRPYSVIAPDYVWDDWHEELWASRGVRVIQGQREQRKPEWRGFSGRILKVGHRALARWLHQDRVYLERNCIFEPVQEDQPRVITDAAVRAVRHAWRRSEPAVLEAHRINFSHLDEAVPSLGRAELDLLLDELVRDEPLFLVDLEMAALQRRGTSWARRGDRLVVRNLTRSDRLVVVPAGQWPGAGNETVVVALAPGESRIYGPATVSGPQTP